MLADSSIIGRRYSRRWGHRRYSEPNGLRVRPRMHHKIVFELAVPPVIDLINSRVHVLQHNARIIRDVRPPLLWIVANEVIRDSRQLVEADDLGMRVRTDQVQLDDRRCWELGARGWGIED